LKAAAVTARASRLWVPALAAVAAASLYLTRLSEAPRFVARDEIVYSLNAESIASTGRDLNGRVLPMYIEYPKGFGRPTWDQPLLIYGIAATLKLLPFSEASIRLPMALAGVVDVLLMFFIARLVFRSDALAAAAAALLALTPAHFIHARMATDFQLWTPFVLGWLLALLLFLDRGSPRYLFIAGVLLGAGIYGYVGAYLFAPLSALLTCLALLARREPLSRLAVFVGGLVLPTVVCLPWMLRSPLPFRDILAHYAVLGGPESSSAASGLSASLWQRIVEIPIVYASFWDPRFLFVDGPLRFRSTQVTPVFLIPLAGLMLLGLVRAMRRREVTDVLIVAGFAVASLPPSVAGESQAVWRALQLAPFGVLLAVLGVEQLARPGPERPRRFAIVVTFGAVIALAVWYHDVLPQAQALVRAATVPLALTGFAAVLTSGGFRQLPPFRLAVVSITTLVVMHAVYLFAHVSTTVAVALLVLLVLIGLVFDSSRAMDRRPALAIVLLTLAVGHFMFEYVDYGAVHRVGAIPATLVILGLRLVASAATVAAILVAARAIRDDAGDRLNIGTVLLILVTGIILVQVAYFAVDRFTDFRVRIVQCALIVVTAAAVVRVVRPGRSTRAGFNAVAIAAVCGLIVIRFSAFHADYFGDFQARGSVDQEGNVRAPYERAIDRASSGSVPAIYLGRIGPYAGGDLYWRFYLLQHRQLHLLERTVVALDFVPERIRALPAGSIAITSPTRQDDVVIDAMAAAGELRGRELIKAPDGSPIFWLLTR
jgi:4-amino-4-deoxy-L-arabinose transferase-like glycosyltransferase